ncbi:MAG TPA: hypothetical protein VIK54_03530 [Acidimicrobiia bacterium]
MNARSFALVFVALALVLGVAACGSSKSGSASAPGQIIAPTPSAKDPAPFPAPSDPMARTRAAGLVPEPAEELAYHVHSHLDVFIDAVHILVPAGLGIDTTNRGVHKLKTDGLPSYGGIVVPCDSPCISPLHTHDVTGILHTESSTPKGNTLGELFIEWNVRLDANCFASYCKPDTAVAVYVNGTRFAGDPRTITLVDRTEIAVVVGTPPAQIPNTADWTQI